MSSFLGFVQGDGPADECCEALCRAHRYLLRGNEGDPLFKVKNDWSLATVYPRCNGSGTPIAIDPATGSWLAALGTWFHDSRNNHPAYLLQRYLDGGAQQLARELNGFFALVIGDAGSRATLVITDVVGSLHFYCRQTNSGTALSTSSRALARLASVTLDPTGCDEFISTGVMYEERTFYKEVRKLPPATISTFLDGKLADRSSYWAPAELNPDSLSAEDARERLWETLSIAVHQINGNFDSVVCDLTGGYDSRAVLAAFLGGDKRFATVVSGPEESQDVTVSAGLAEMLDLQHLHYPGSASPITAEEQKCILRATDGECDLTEYIHVARIHRDLSRQFAISINGSFGELARGYWWELLFPSTGKCRKLDSRRLAQRRYVTGSQSTLLQSHLHFDLVTHFQGVVDRTIAGLEGCPNTFQMDITYLRMRMQRWQGRLASSTNQIWPCLSPFMFRPVLETMLQARSAARRRSLLIRLMLARYQPPLANYPLEHGYPAQPASWANVGRFWPLAPYYGKKVVKKIQQRLHVDRADLTPAVQQHLWSSDLLRDVFIPSSMKSTSIFDMDRVKSLVSDFQPGGVRAGSQLSRLLSLELALSADEA